MRIEMATFRTLPDHSYRPATQFVSTSAGTRRPGWFMSLIIHILGPF